MSKFLEAVARKEGYLKSQPGNRANKGLTVKQAMYKYAPPSENDTEGFIQFICQRVGCTPDTLVEEFIQFICQRVGCTSDTLVEELL